MRTAIITDMNALANAAAEFFIAQAQSAIQARGQFAAALSGGSTPRAVYQRLAEAPLAWKNIHLFWGDERCVPPDHPDSNYHMTAESLLTKIGIPSENVHRIQGELSPELAAARYEQGLRAFFGDAPRWKTWTTACSNRLPRLFPVISTPAGKANPVLTSAMTKT